MQSEIPSGIVNMRIGIFECVNKAPATQLSRRKLVTQFSRRADHACVPAIQRRAPLELCVPAIPRCAPLDVVHACTAHVQCATVDVLKPHYKLAPRKRVLRLAVRCTPVTRFA
jgi:hypothetical protein